MIANPNCSQMNIPTNRVFQLHTSDQVYLRRILTTEIKVIQDSQYILYQVPFELTKSPSRTWKEMLLDTWCSIREHNCKVSGTVMWVFHNRILIDKVPIEQVKNKLETLVTVAVYKTNKQMATKEQHVI